MFTDRTQVNGAKKGLHLRSIGGCRPSWPADKGKGMAGELGSARCNSCLVMPDEVAGE